MNCYLINLPLLVHSVKPIAIIVLIIVVVALVSTKVATVVVVRCLFVRRETIYLERKEARTLVWHKSDKTTYKALLELDAVARDPRIIHVVVVVIVKQTGLGHDHAPEI
jgi:hypothetical protein